MMKRTKLSFVHRRALASTLLVFCLIGGNLLTGYTAGQHVKTRGSKYPVSAPRVESSGNFSGSFSESNASVSEAKLQTAHTRIDEIYGNLPMSFEPSVGQADPQAGFISRGSGYTLMLAPTEVVMNLTQPRRSEKIRTGKFKDTPASAASSPSRRSASSVIRFKFIGASAQVKLSGLDRLPGTTNYLRGNDPSKWQTDVANFARVKYEGIYPGVDLIYYGNQSHLEYDLKLAPGADPRTIAFEMQGAKRLTIDKHGALVAHTSAGEVRQEKPLIYQEADGVKQPVGGGYAMRGKRRVGFKVSSYDASKPLVIDPSIKYTFKVGGNNNISVNGVAVDVLGNLYMTGSTQATDFPTVNPIQGSLGGGGMDAFVSKVNPQGTALVYSTYLGGSNLDSGAGIAVDADGNAYVTGFTQSTDFPMMNALQGANAGGGDAFVTKLNASGNGLVYSTYLGGSSSDQGFGIAVDSANNAYITGRTFSTNFPVMNPFRATKASTFVESDAFVTTLNASGALLYSTYFGGTGNEEGHGIATDGLGNAYITGFTSSGGGDFPTTTGALQTLSGGGRDAFIAELNTSASGAASLVYSTFLGGNSEDMGNAIAVDNSGNTYVAGETSSPNFPRANQFQNDLRGVKDAFVTKLNAAGTALVYSTYLGGGSSDVGSGIAIDLAGNAFVTGTTTSSDFPMKDPVKGSLRGPDDAFVTELNPAGSGLVFSTYFGGSGNDNGNAIAVPLAGGAVYVGITSDSTDFPRSLSSRIVPQDDTGRDFGVAAAFLIGDPLVAIKKTADKDSVIVGEVITFTITVTIQNSDVNRFSIADGPGNTKPITWIDKGAFKDSAGSTIVTTFEAFRGTREFKITGKYSEPGEQSNKAGLTALIERGAREFGDLVGLSEVRIHVNPAPPVAIFDAAMDGKNLDVCGTGSVEGATILLNGDAQRTLFSPMNLCAQNQVKILDATPTVSLVGKKTGKRIKPGETVKLQVRNPDGTLSNEFTFTRPQ